MKKNTIIILLIFAIPLITYFMLTLSNSTTAKTAQEGKPQVIKFTSQMCMDCQTMNNVFKEIFPKHKDNIVLTEIQVQDDNPYNKSMIKKHNVTLVPTIILIDSQGKVVKRIEGAVPASDMDKCLEDLK
jgi:thiol:disulfide interchange protein